MPTRTISQTIDLTNKPINKYITEITSKNIYIVEFCNYRRKK